MSQAKGAKKTRGVQDVKEAPHAATRSEAVPNKLSSALKGISVATGAQTDGTPTYALPASLTSEGADVSNIIVESVGVGVCSGSQVTSEGKTDGHGDDHGENSSEGSGDRGDGSSGSGKGSGFGRGSGAGGGSGPNDADKSEEDSNPDSTPTRRERTPLGQASRGALSAAAHDACCSQLAGAELGRIELKDTMELETLEPPAAQKIVVKRVPVLYAYPRKMISYPFREAFIIITKFFYILLNMVQNLIILGCFHFLRWLCL